MEVAYTFYLTEEENRLLKENAKLCSSEEEYIKTRLMRPRDRIVIEYNKEAADIYTVDVLLKNIRKALTNILTISNSQVSDINPEVVFKYLRMADAIYDEFKNGDNWKYSTLNRLLKNQEEYEYEYDPNAERKIPVSFTCSEEESFLIESGMRHCVEKLLLPDRNADNIVFCDIVSSLAFLLEKLLSTGVFLMDDFYYYESSISDVLHRVLSIRVKK